jgi:hypothetical protein
MFSTRKSEGNEENEQIFQAYFLSLEVAFYVSTRKYARLWVRTKKLSDFACEVRNTAARAGK